MRGETKCEACRDVMRTKCNRSSTLMADVLFIRLDTSCVLIAKTSSLIHIHSHNTYTHLQCRSCICLRRLVDLKLHPTDKFDIANTRFGVNGIISNGFSLVLFIHRPQMILKGYTHKRYQI